MAENGADTSETDDSKIEESGTKRKLEEGETEGEGEPLKKKRKKKKKSKKSMNTQYLDHAKRKSFFQHMQNVQTQNILCMRQFSSGLLFSIDTFYCSQ